VRSDALARRAEQLAAQGASYVTATVVRAQRPTSAHAGDVALVTNEGEIEGFVGGVCAEASVKLFSWTAITRNEPILLRILPTIDDQQGGTGDLEDGAVTVLNTCLSGGAIEIFLEPTVPLPRVHVAGSRPISAEIARQGTALELDMVLAGDDPPDVRSGDLAMIVAAHGKGELTALRAALDADLPYVGLVASPKRGSALVQELRDAGLPEDKLARIECPAGLDIGARMPAEVALSILARIVETRRVTVAPKFELPKSSRKAGPGKKPEAPATAICPISRMTVLARDSTPHLEVDGKTLYFSSEDCKTEYEQEHSGAVAAP
jgi:xanthine dehydrogenase accessory factor